MDKIAIEQLRKTIIDISIMLMAVSSHNCAGRAEMEKSVSKLNRILKEIVKE